MSQVKLSGGETFLCKDLGAIIGCIQSSLHGKVPITVFTAGRHWVAPGDTEVAVAETVKKLLSSGPAIVGWWNLINKNHDGGSV